MDALEAIGTRRSVRDYLPDAISDETIEQLIEAAIRAPSALNRQPWSFTVLRDQTLLDRISEGAKDYMRGARPLELPDHLFEKLADPSFHIFNHAPVLIIIAGNIQAPWICEDCSLAAANLMLAAHASELGACWIGLCQLFLATPEGRRMVSLSDQEIPVAPIIIGNPRTEPQLTRRNPPVVRWID